CVAEAVEQHALPAARERAQHREVCHVAGGEQQRALATGEGRQLLFQALVLGAVAADQMRGTAPRAAARRAGAHGGGGPRVARETQVVVAAEVDELTPAGPCPD